MKETKRQEWSEELASCHSSGRRLYLDRAEKSNTSKERKNKGEGKKERKKERNDFFFYK